MDSLHLDDWYDLDPARNESDDLLLQNSIDCLRCASVNRHERDPPEAIYVFMYANALELMSTLKWDAFPARES